jgi:hypothetical protein
MKSQLAKLLSGIAAIGIATSACGLTIVPTFDGSITNDPNGSAMTNAIYAAIHVFQTKITDSGTVKIHFTNDPTVGLGQSLTWGNNYSYSAYLSALRSRATSINDTNGLSKIPNTSTDPLTHSNQIYMNLALAVHMGLDSGYGPDGLDSTISLNMSEMNFSRPPLDSSKYDIAQVAEHEMDEVLGTSSDLYYGSPISPIDLFRYATNLARTYTTSDDNAYFSVDGTNLLARFNMDSGGDYSDWWSINNLWAPPGQTPVSQVQDAFSLPGNALDLGTNELAMLDVIGWTLAVTAQSTTPTLSIVRSGANQFTLSWPNTYSGFVLEERTNLTAGSWAFSTSGSTNPAVIVSATALKFYRLYKPATPAEQPAINTTAALISTNTTLQLHLHVTRPRRPSTD